MRDRKREAKGQILPKMYNHPPHHRLSHTASFGGTCANLHKKRGSGRVLKKVLHYHCRTLQSSRMLCPSCMRNPAHCFIICLGKSMPWQVAFSPRRPRCQGVRASAHPVSNHQDELETRGILSAIEIRDTTQLASTFGSIHQRQLEAARAIRGAHSA